VPVLPLVPLPVAQTLLMQTCVQQSLGCEQPMPPLAQLLPVLPPVVVCPVCDWMHTPSKHAPEQHEVASEHVAPIASHPSVPPAHAPFVHSWLQQFRFCVQKRPLSWHVVVAADLSWQYAWSDSSWQLPVQHSPSCWHSCPTPVHGVALGALDDEQATTTAIAASAKGSPAEPARHAVVRISSAVPPSPRARKPAYIHTLDRWPAPSWCQAWIAGGSASR
jgi:hypothetical protein